MKRRVSIIAMAAALSACGGGGSSGSSGSGSGTTNSAPVVNAGTDQTVAEGTDVTLAATVTDADGDTLTYTWSQTSGTAGTFSSTSIEDPIFTAPSVTADEALVLQLSVSDGTVSVSDTVTINVTDSGTTSSVAGWIINNTERSDFIDESTTSGQGVLYDVQSATEVTISGVDYVEVQTTGIPKFDTTITQEILDELAARPRPTVDFSSGVTTATLGDVVQFGEDIGYNSSTENCDTTGGAGYWPPGPTCPVTQDRTAYFPVTQTDSTEDCDTGIGAIGLYINGAAVFGWGDTFSYNNQGVFFNLAANNEVYDVDICQGHAAMGEYHNHQYSRCLADLVGDDGTDHSPLIGYAADGYPIYGPYESAGVLAVSGWAARDYGAATSEGGCGTPGERTCILVDEFDVSQGVDFSVSQGPDIDAAVTSLSGNPLTAFDGFYYEDYYYTGAVGAGAQLDQFNGHDNGDGRGYHYHETMIDDGTGTNVPVFPYTLGPILKGEVLDNGIAGCGGAGGPGGGMPPPPGG